MKNVLKIINSQMKSLGLNYEFSMMTKTPVEYPYWVGEISEMPINTEDGLETATVILTGFSRKSFLELETQKEQIKSLYKHGFSTMTGTGAAVYIFYDGAVNVPCDDPDLKKAQVNLEIKIWKE